MAMISSTNVSGAVRSQRGAGYRIVETAVVRPGEDIGHIAAACYRKHGAGSARRAALAC